MNQTHPETLSPVLHLFIFIYSLPRVRYKANAFRTSEWTGIANSFQIYKFASERICNAYTFSWFFIWWLDYTVQK